MSGILASIKNNLEPVKEVIALAIVDFEDCVIHSSDNWDIEKELSTLNSVWGSLQRELTLFGESYSILHNSKELLIAIIFEKGKVKENKPKEGIVGFRNEDNKIYVKISDFNSLRSVVANAARVLTDIRRKEPYIKSGEIFSKTKFDLTPKILSDTSHVLEKVGLNQFGISEDEAKVYLALLRKGEDGDKVGNLDKELLLKRTHIYRIINRLVEKNWVEELAKFPRGAQLYGARPIDELLDNVIKEKEEEIKVLKGFKLILGENLENGWNLDNLDLNDLKKPFDLDIKEITGFEKDNGIVIFEYDRLIKDEENLDRVKLRLYSEKLKQEIKENAISDLEYIEIDEVKISNYLGANIKIKFRKNSNISNNLGSDWIIVAKLVAIPIDNKIYVIWGSEQKFPYLLNIIQKLK